jgi:hypothetical protein
MLGVDGQTLPDYLHFPAVDGGATDNEPIALAHPALAGLLGRDPRDKNLANWAVLFIDPFAGQTRLGPELPLFENAQSFGWVAPRNPSDSCRNPPYFCCGAGSSIVKT